MSANKPKRPAPAARRPTMSDIAEAAGVSPATVSHVFSGHRPVSPDAAEAVHRVAAWMGYTPNSTARALASGRSFVIALYVPFAADDLVVSPFFASSIVTISTAIAADGYALLMLPSEPDAAEANTRTLFQSRRIDGVLMLDPSPADQRVAAAIDDTGLPLVTVGKLKDRDHDAWVDGDVRAQFTDALDHLDERGYRRPALASFPGEQSFLCEAEEAYRTWNRSRRRKPIVCKTSGVVDGSPDRCVQDLLLTDFDSIVCVDDGLALTIRRNLESLGRSGIGIIGTGDSRQAREASPPLTSIATHAVDRGRYASTLLIDLIANREPASRQIVVAHELVVRDSTPGVDRAH